MNIRIFDRNAELHASQVNATLYIKTKPVWGTLLIASRSVQLMLKTIRFAALGREQANSRVKRNPRQSMRRTFALTKRQVFCSVSHIRFCLWLKAILFI